MKYPYLLAVLVLASVLTSASLARAQEEADPEEAGTTVTVEVDEPPPTLAAVGISTGFPSYQTVAPAFSVQSGHVGMQLKVSWTPAGPYIGLQLRGYPPVSLPVPIFIGAGAGFYGSDLSYHAALGAHVPLGLAMRLDLEAGVASVPFLDSRRIAPHLAAGISYAFPVEISTGEGVSREGPMVTASCAEPREPDVSALRSAFSGVLDEWIRSARATYGSIYTDLSYRYDVIEETVSGDSGTVVIRYSGSVTEIATGVRHSASGEASASFRWNGCGWSDTGVSY